MNNTKIKRTLSHQEIDFLIDVLKQDKTNLQSILNNKELDYVFKMHNKLIFKLTNILKEELKKITNKNK
tara:strand:+ start:344 stop:550 length:207 start_codon:yes stop_codon:yes gene_type:complete